MAPSFSNKRGNAVRIINTVRQFRINKKAVSQIAFVALSRLRYRKAQLNLAFVPDIEIRRLNQRFLKRNRPTDVLAFPYTVIPAKAGIRKYRSPIKTFGDDRWLLGEVVISLHRAKVQAPAYCVTFQEELARYICHGILHLAGFRDKTQKEWDKMHRKEDQILSRCKKQIQKLIQDGNSKS